MNNSDIQRIHHIKTYCEDIADAINRFGNSFDVFEQDRDFFNSVSMSVLQIGELSVGLSDEFKEANREQVPWELMKGMRNRFAHAYAAMSKSDIWDTAMADIPNLLRFCNGILEKAAK